MNELKLHAVEQDTTIAALTGITLPERAARIKTLPSLVLSGLRPRNDDPSIDTSPDGLSDL
jgi:hypothetical protein